MRILLGDDERDFRKAVARALRDAGHEVTEVATPQEALEICTLDGPDYDVMITDVCYLGSDMNGLELLYTVRRMEGHVQDEERLPIIVWTGGEVPKVEPGPQMALSKSHCIDIELYVTQIAQR